MYNQIFSSLFKKYEKEIECSSKQSSNNNNIVVDHLQPTIVNVNNVAFSEAVIHPFASKTNGSRRVSIIQEERPKLPMFLDHNKMPIIAPDSRTISECLDSENNTLSENETQREISFVEAVSILYKNNNQEINDKYSDMINELNRIGDMNFNVFNLSKYSNGNELFIIMNHLYKLSDFEKNLNLDSETYKNYFYKVNSSYRKNHFHNSIHACDVVQTAYFLIKTCNIDLICNLSDLNLFCCYFAAAVHDVDHPGNNNNYEVAIGSKLAVSYNDKAVLENYHLFKAFSLLQFKDCDIFNNFNCGDYNIARSTIINMVLSTDMANHFLDLNILKQRTKAEDFDPQNIDKQVLLNQVIHSCDISNPIKPITIYKEWVQRLFKEFYNQGDKEREKGLNISFLCDRHTVNIADAQVGFIDGIVLPLYQTLAVAFPNLLMINNLIINNKEEFKKLKESKYKFI